MTLKVTLVVWNICNTQTTEIYRVLSAICFFYLHVNRKVHVACIFNYLFQNEKFLKVGLHCKCGNISETVQDGVVVTTD